jgi:anti-sigma B factor antagonist
MWHSVDVTDFAVSVQSSGSGSTVLDLVGELDLAGAPAMRESGLAALGDPGCSTLVLDVEKLTFVDSTGIGSWVELHNHAQQQDQRLVLRSVSANLERILTIAGLATLFELDGHLPRAD